MAKYLIVGDLQLQTSNIDKAKRLFSIIESYGLPVIWLGDMLEKRGLVEANCLNILYDYFYRSKLKHYVVVGNHDLLGVHSEETALEPLKALDNVYIHDKPDCAEDIIVMPYFRNPQKFLATIESFGRAKTQGRILICHQGIREFTIGSGYTEEDAIELKDVAQFKLALVGHYHTPKQCSNVVYLGSPFSHSFGESNENKRLAILDTDTCMLEYIPTNFSRHITIERTLPLQEPIEVRYFGFGESKTLADFYRAIISGTEEELKVFQSEVAPMFSGVKFIYKVVNAKCQVIISENLTNNDKFVKWAKEVKNLDDSTINVGLELLK